MSEATESIEGLLENCFEEYANDFHSFQYNLEAAEVKKIAEISRKACDYYDKGVVLLLIYFIKSCRSL